MDPSGILQHHSWSTVTDALTMSTVYVDCITPVRNTHTAYFCWNLLVIFPDERIWNTSTDYIQKGPTHYGHACLGICEFCLVFPWDSLAKDTFPLFGSTSCPCEEDTYIKGFFSPSDGLR